MNKPYDDVLVWAAWCSNPERSVEDCAEKTRSMLAELPVEIAAEAWVIDNLRQICRNRGNDASFAVDLLTEGNASLARGCFEAMLELISTGANFPDMPALLDQYVTEHGEDRAFITIKLRWLTYHADYRANLPEVERILEILQRPEA